MNTNPLVSVVIPCYNHANYLTETVESVLNSNYQPLEIIIVDDGSSDNSLEVAHQLAEKHNSIQVFSHKNSGPSKTRNRGVKEATGKYILPLDADDLISENYISEGVKVLEKSSDILVAYALAKKFGAVNKVWKLKSFSPYQLAKDNMIYVSGLYRKSDWQRIGGYSESKDLVREDWEFWIKMLKNGGKALQMPFFGFYYRILPDSRRKSMTKEKKNKEIDYLNANHADFFEEQLEGKLHYQRTFSKLLNRINRILRNVKS